MIRVLNLADCDRIAGLILQILEDMELPIIKKLGSREVARLFALACADPTYRCGYARGIGVELDGVLAGVAFGYPDEDLAIIDKPFARVLTENGYDASWLLFEGEEALPNEWYLDSIAVDPAFQGQGVGTKLLQALPSLAQKAGRQTIGLCVDKKNPQAKKLYQRIGFDYVTDQEISGHQYEHLQKRA
jgi:ribosomal protein S18 acetylase RimI-like enzyme